MNLTEDEDEEEEEEEEEDEENEEQFGQIEASYFGALNEECGYKRGGARPNLPPRKRKDLKMDSFKNCMRELYSIATIENTSEALSGL